MRIELDQFIRTTAAAQCNMRYNKRPLWNQSTYSQFIWKRLLCQFTVPELILPEPCFILMNDEDMKEGIEAAHRRESILAHQFRRLPECTLHPEITLVI